MALDSIATKDLATTVADFLRGWPNVKWPISADYIPQVYERAKLHPIPGLEHLADNNGLGILAAMCKLLQEDNHHEGDGMPMFFLACRTPADLLGVSHQTVAKWLYLLEKLSYIRTLTKGGTPENPRRATRFQYTGPNE